MSKRWWLEPQNSQESDRVYSKLFGPYKFGTSSLTWNRETNRN